MKPPSGAGANLRSACEPAWLRWGLAALIVVACFVVFWPLLQAQFINFDDDKGILQNYEFRGLAARNLRWMFSTTVMGHYQPLSWLTMAIDHALWGLTGPTYPEAPAFHRTNLVLHALTSVAFYFLARRLLGTVARRQSAAGAPSSLGMPLAAALAALLFAVHPLRCESVGWVTERRDVLSGFLFVLSVTAYLAYAPVGSPGDIRGARFVVAIVTALLAVLAFFFTVHPVGGAMLGLGVMGVWGLVLVVALFAVSASASATAISNARQPRKAFAYAMALLFMFLSLLAKAWGMVIPILLLVLDVWPLGRWPRTEKNVARAVDVDDQRHTPRDAATATALTLIGEKVPFVVLSVVFATLASWAIAGQVATVKTWEEHPLLARLAQAFYGLAFYPFKTLMPTGLIPIYPLAENLNPLEPRFIISFVVVILTTALIFWQRRRWAAVATAFFAYVVIVAPVLGLMQAGPQLVADRYSYLSCMPFALLAAGGAWLAARRHGDAARAALTAASVGVTLILGILTYRQATVWQSSDSLWSHTLRTDPNSTIALLNLGMVRKNQALAAATPAEKTRLLNEAAELYKRGLQLEENARTYSNLASVYNLMARQDQDRAEAARHLEEALAASTASLRVAQAKHLDFAEFHLNHGVALLGVGQLSAALEQFQGFVRSWPNQPVGRNNLGVVLLRMGQPQAAVEHLRWAVTIEPSFAEAWYNLARAYKALGDGANAEAATAAGRRAEMAARGASSN